MENGRGTPDCEAWTAFPPWTMGTIWYKSMQIKSPFGKAGGGEESIMTAGKKKKKLKPAFMSVRNVWTRRPVTTVRGNAKKADEKSRCRGTLRSGDAVCAVAA